MYQGYASIGNNYTHQISQPINPHIIITIIIIIVQQTELTTVFKTNTKGTEIISCYTFSLLKGGTFTIFTKHVMKRLVHSIGLNVQLHSDPSSTCKISSGKI